MEWTNGRNSADAESTDNTCVLVVDDDWDCREMLEALLTMEGFRVTSAVNGDEALAFLKSRSFRIMITDYNMPEMDGLRLSQIALKAAPEMIIIMVTGDPLTQIYPKAVELGITDVLAKPFEIKNLLNIIHEENMRRINFLAERMPP